MANVFAFAESRNGEVRKAGLEAVSAARQIADQTGGGEVHALVAGGPGIAGQAERLAAAGADVVLVGEHPGLALYNPEAVAATVARWARVTAGRRPHHCRRRAGPRRSRPSRRSRSTPRRRR